MSRPVTLFTGQWADLSLADLLPKVKEMGYDGVELACWGDHFDVDAPHLLMIPMLLKSGSFSISMALIATLFLTTS